ncbi:ANTAR domain-containing protein [Kineococcus gypseus]|uniref:GAF and ANTAR domain-containing protein n=1 Tax=Kineococcus gypseus TaxID=1637102 RepID=UPI003D7E0346
MSSQGDEAVRSAGRAGAGTRDPELLLERLQVVSEELAVADDELAAQQREIDDLLAREVAAREVLATVVASVPVPFLSTGAAGAVTSANRAAADLLGVPAPRLVGKPVQAFVVPADRSRARTLLSTAATRGSAAGEFTLAPRHGAPVAVRVVVTAAAPRTAPAAALTWVLAPRGTDTGERADRDAEQALQAVAGLAALPVGEAGTHEVLAAVAALATRALPGASWSSVLLGDPRSPRESATDSEQAQAFDGAQWRADQGPCPQAWADAAPVTCTDVTADPRWPALAGPAAATAVRAVLALPLRIEEEVVGVLGVYGPAGADLTGARDLERALVFARAAEAVLQDLRRVEELRSTAEHLRTALGSRATIDQAKGVVAAWIGCGVEEAFTALTTLSQDRNVKVRDLAALVVADPSRRELVPLLAAAHERAQRRAAG